MNWSRSDANWSELKRKAKRQLEPDNDYNINMYKSNVKPHAISIASPDGANLETKADQRLNPRHKPLAKQGA